MSDIYDGQTINQLDSPVNAQQNSPLKIENGVG